MLEKNQVYVVVDIEADGPVPGLYSMLSLAAVATNQNAELGHFYQKILPLKGARQFAPTMAWWKTQPEAWAEVTTDARDAKQVMLEFDKWLSELGREPIFVAQPVGFDYTFVSWYYWHFLKRNRFTDKDRSVRNLDLSSFIAGKFDRSLDQSRRKNWPAWFREGMPEHSHNALDDARGYAYVLRKILSDKKVAK